MIYELNATEFFISQLDELDIKIKGQIREKLELIKENHYRYKRLHSKTYSRAFRVRLKIQNRESRLVYVVLGTRIIIVAILDRTKGYRDLEKYLENIK